MRSFQRSICQFLVHYVLMYWLDISNIKANYDNTLRIFEKNADISKWISLYKYKEL